MEDFVPYEIVLKLEKKGYKGKTIRYHGHIYDVFKWLRDKNIHLYTDIDNEGWFFEIKCLKTRFMVNTDFFKRYSTCELATFAGIEYIIDNNFI